MWFGKILAAIFGYMVAGPIGALIGFFVGHVFDKGLSQTFSMTGVVHPPGSGGAEIHSAFFKAVFVVMGRLAKADGRICENEIALAEQLMTQMQLPTEQRNIAIELFKQGADAEFDYTQPLRDFIAVASTASPVRETYLTLLISLALVDHDYHRNEKAILMQVSELLGFSAAQFERLFSMIYAQTQFGSNQNAPGKSAEKHLEEAYEALGVSRESSLAEVKLAYRKLISEHHPDKLIAQGVPEEMIKIATEKSQQIHSAYELIKISLAN